MPLVAVVDDEGVRSILLSSAPGVKGESRTDLSTSPFRTVSSSTSVAHLLASPGIGGGGVLILKSTNDCGAVL